MQNESCLCNQLNKVAMNELAVAKETPPDLYGSFQVLRLNQKMEPNFLTNHNLAVFLLNEGWISKSTGRGNKRYSLTLQYLNNALSFQEHFLTYCALGELYFNTKQFEKAEDALKQALIKVQNSAILNNIGVVLFHQKKYPEAKEAFEKALALCDVEQRFYILLSLGFSCYFLKDGRAIEVLNDLKTYTDQYEPDVIRLAYLLKDNHFILENYERVFRIYATEPIDIQIIKKARGQREKEIDLEKIIFYPQKTFQCYYLDCPIHGNSVF